jgi:Protein of unknown function (DUF1326)
VTYRRAEWCRLRGGRCDGLALQGTYFENRNCDIVCPCSTSGLSALGDFDRCYVALAFHVDPGDVDGIDVSGLPVAVVADAPPLMGEGDWRGGITDGCGRLPRSGRGARGSLLGSARGPMEGLAHSSGRCLAGGCPDGVRR